MSCHHISVHGEACLFHEDHHGVCSFSIGGLKSPMQEALVNLEDMPKEIQQGLKYDSNKPLPSLLPPKALDSVIKVLTFGAKKYSRENWRNVPRLQERYLDALMRHLFSFHGGEVNDPETKLPHLAHAVCCALYLIEDGAKEEVC